MLPQHTADLLYGGGDWTLPGEDGQECEGAKFHSPTPLFVHSVRLVPYEWLHELSINPGVAPAAVWLCGVCRDNLAILQQIYKAASGEVAWPVRREFGNELRALAQKGWDRYARVAGRKRTA